MKLAFACCMIPILIIVQALFWTYGEMPHIEYWKRIIMCLLYMLEGFIFCYILVCRHINKIAKIEAEERLNELIRKDWEIRIQSLVYPIDWNKTQKSC